MDETLNVEIGTHRRRPLDSRRNVVRGEEATMGNLIADAMREATGADIAHHERRRHPGRPHL